MIRNIGIRHIGIRNIGIRHTVCVPINKMVFLSLKLESGETLLTKYIYFVPFKFNVFYLEKISLGSRLKTTDNWSLDLELQTALGIFELLVFSCECLTLACHEMQQFGKFPN